MKICSQPLMSKNSSSTARNRQLLPVLIHKRNNTHIYISCCVQLPPIYSLAESQLTEVSGRIEQFPLPPEASRCCLHYGLYLDPPAGSRRERNQQFISTLTQTSEKIRSEPLRAKVFTADVAECLLSCSPLTQAESLLLIPQPNNQVTSEVRQSLMFPEFTPWIHPNPMSHSNFAHRTMTDWTLVPSSVLVRVLE